MLAYPFFTHTNDNIAGVRIGMHQMGAEVFHSTPIVFKKCAETNTVAASIEVPSSHTSVIYIN